MSPDVGPNVPIALVVSDIDGTLVNRAKQITPRARGAVEALRERGIAFSVASARPPAGLRAIIQALGITAPVGAANGGAVVGSDLSVLERMLVPVEAARLTVETLLRQGIDPWLFTEDGWFLHDPEGAHVDHEAKTLAMIPTVVEAIDDALLGRALKLVGASHDHPLLAACEDMLQASFGGTALASRSQSYYLDVTNAAANKGGAVRGVARQLGVPIERVMTIGDGYNDTPMFEVGAFSVAMGNAPDAVQRMAMAVTDSCEDEGFAKAVERYVLAPYDRAAKGAAPAAAEQGALS